MSLRRVGWFAVLAMMVAWTPLRGSVPNPPPRHAAVRALSRAAGAGLLTNLRSHFVDTLPGARGVPPARSLLVQSKDIKNLGLGKLLVASRDLADPNFAETVVLLVHYDDKSVVGLVLNRRSRVPLSRVLEEQAAKDRTDPVYLGGPVDTPSVFALLQSPAKVEGADHVFGGVYLIDTKPLFEQTISAHPEAGVFHVFLGYAGWANIQLKMEVALGSWFIFPADAKTVFDPDPDTLWSRMIRKTELELAVGGPEPFR